MRFKELRKEFEQAKKNYFISDFEKSILGKRYGELTEEEKKIFEKNMQEDDIDIECEYTIYYRERDFHKVDYNRIETELERPLSDYEKEIIESGEIQEIRGEEMLYESKTNQRIKFVCKHIFFIYDSDERGNCIVTYDIVFPAKNVIYVSTNCFIEEMLELRGEIESQKEKILDNEFDCVSDNLEYDILDDMLQDLDEDLELEEIYFD